MSNPTRSVSKSYKYGQKKTSYKNMTQEEQMNHDLAQDQANEQNLKTVIKSKGYKSKKINKYIEKVVGKFDPKIVHVKNLVYAGRDLISIRINEDKFAHRAFTINKIEKLSNKLSDYLAKKEVNGKMMILEMKPNYTTQINYII